LLAEKTIGLIFGLILSRKSLIPRP